MKDTQNQNSYEAQRRINTGVWAAIIFSLLDILSLGLIINTVSKQGYSDWADPLFIATAAIVSFGNIYTISLIKKTSKYTLGMGILFFLNLVFPVMSGVILIDFGIFALGFLAVFSYIMFQWVLPENLQRPSLTTSALAAIIIIVADLINPSFQLGNAGFKDIAPIVAIITGIILTLFILRLSWRRTIRIKILVGFGIISVIGGLFSFVGSQFAVEGVTTNALPNLEALGDIKHAVRSVQAETLEFVALGEPESISEFYEKTSELNDIAKELERLATPLDQSNILSNLNNDVAKMIFISESILQSHQQTLGFLDDATAHQDLIQLAQKNAQGILKSKMTTVIANEHLVLLSEKIIPAQNSLTDFLMLTNALNQEAQAFAATGKEENSINFSNTALKLTAERITLVSLLEQIGGQKTLIQDLKELETQTLSIGQDIISSHAKTLASLEKLEESEDQLQESLEALKGLTDEGVLAGLQVVTSYTIITSLIAILISLIVGYFITRTIAIPLSRLVDATQELEKGNFSVRANLRPGDELGTLANAFNRMASQLGRTLTSLEEEVTTRTAALRQRSNYLESAANVSQTISAIDQPEEIIKQVVNIIQTRFDFYYVGLFLMDKNQEWAVLQTGTGLPGEAMLARKHRIRSGEGMIGWSIANAASRIALDVGEDNVQFANPDLPETRSEAALPLRSRGRVLGALTVQSVEEAAFNDDIVSTLQTMADQIASALDNANLFAQSEAALGAERKAYGELSQKEWISFAQSQVSSRFVSDASSQAAYPLDVEQSPEILEAIRADNLIQDEGKTMLVPLVSHNIILGGIKLRKRDGDGVWSKAQIALTKNLSGQLSIALDSARLFDQTQKRAAQEKVIAQTSAKMKETLDVESVLETAAKELRNALGIKTAEVWISVDEEAKN